MIDFILLGSAFQPFIQFSIKQMNEHGDVIDRLDELRKNAEDIWNDAINRIELEDSITKKSRLLQNEIFEHRSKSPMILDFFYKMLRDKNEELINKSTKQLLEDAKEKGF